MITKFEDIFQTVYNGEPASVQEALLKIKEAGASQMESAIVLVKRLKLSLSTADSIILSSDAWNEGSDNVIKMREDFGNFLNNVE